MINLNRLKGLRVENGFTQKEMAKKINMPEATYQKKESGETQFLLIEADKIAKVFQKDIKDIFFTN
ncbi:helix-turn-helix transcriptional regulator [Romboutsia sp. 1001713B170207_170306_H8]|uniref:helix-turn-helix transcriptional regulator n=1 Tax=Romboutsia sp. 1001713B170207_170306_H8 TaxID=2787112 RepID=UPI0018986F41|nr:helix-turn-helix domain-containing protein [Romboutsia sp. 1001713B170207_170306_H8]